MVVDALVKADDYLKISLYPFDPAQFWKVFLLLCDISYFILTHLYSEAYLLIVFCSQLDDTILKTIEFADSKKLKESRNIIQRIRRRDLYQVISKFCLSNI